MPRVGNPHFGNTVSIVIFRHAFTVDPKYIRDSDIATFHVMQKRIHQNPALQQNTFAQPSHHTSLGSAGCGSRERCESTGGRILWCCRCHKLDRSSQDLDFVARGQWFQSRWVIACWKLLHQQTCPNQSCQQGVYGSQVLKSGLAVLEFCRIVEY